MSSYSPAEIIEAFLARASRVVNSELVNATMAEIESGYSFNVRVMGIGNTEIRYTARNEYYVKGLAADLRPFLPWVDDPVKLSRVFRALIRSLTDPEWKKRCAFFQEEYKKVLSDTMFSSWWSIPSQQWQMGMTDLELAKTVLNQHWFHENMDPRMRAMLDSEHQQMSNYHAVWRLLNHTVVFVVVLRKLITEAADAGVLNPRVR